MKAIRLHTNSGPSGMVYEEAPQPHPKEGEVLVRVYAAAITPGEHLWPETWKAATGQERSRPIPGHECSGVVNPNIILLKITPFSWWASCDSPGEW
jgi:NADPH:quinone reductase-like Zn-dependent oxidoreductase